MQKVPWKNIPYHATCLLFLDVVPNCDCYSARLIQSVQYKLRLRLSVQCKLSPCCKSCRRLNAHNWYSILTLYLEVYNINSCLCRLQDTCESTAPYIASCPEASPVARLRPDDSSAYAHVIFSKRPPQTNHPKPAPQAASITAQRLHTVPTRLSTSPT